jgi:thioesterase domain-containing protein
MGGWIAYAVALELNRQGQQVSFLALLETQATADLPYVPYTWAKLSFLARRMRFHLKNLASVPKIELLRYIRQRGRYLRIHISQGRGNQPEYFLAASSRYRPGKYPGDLDLFVTGNPKGWVWLFWKRLILGRIRIHRTAGDHRTLIDKNHAKAFAALLNEVLHKVEADGECHSVT